MPLPITGSISMSSVNTEIGSSSTATIGLNDSGPRNLAGISSGTISMNDLRGALKMSMGYAYSYSTWGGILLYQYGYYAGSFGSLATTTFPDGKTLYYMMDQISFGSPYFSVCISGFSSNPGATGYFSSVKKQGGGTFYTSSLLSYSYAAGYAYWDWSGNVGFTTSGTAYCKFTA
jgi:hypothetical protein